MRTVCQKFPKKNRIQILTGTKKKNPFNNIFPFNISSYSHKIFLIDFKLHSAYSVLPFAFHLCANPELCHIFTFYTIYIHIVCEFQERLPSSQLNYAQTQNSFLVFPIHFPRQWMAFTYNVICIPNAIPNFNGAYVFVCAHETCTNVCIKLHLGEMK